MRTHREIDERSLALAQAVVAKIDADPRREGLSRARETCARWYRQDPSRAIAEWQTILQGEWDTIRLVLLDEGEEGQRLRQSNPFCKALSPRERWNIYRRFAHEQTAALRYVEIEQFADEFEMAEIGGNAELNRSLKRGLKNTKEGRGRFV